MTDEATTTTTTTTTTAKPKKGKGKKAKATTPKKESTGKRGAPHKLIDWAPKAEQKELRPGTRRAKCRDLLARKNGTTLEEIMTVCEWNQRQAKDALHILHYTCGYGIKEYEKNRIRLVQPS